MSLNLQRIAWAVMLGAFFTFCGICAFTVYGTYSFLFQSTVPMTAIAQASRGSIGITGADLREDVERGTRALGLNNLVRPNDQDSQGVILIQDPYREEGASFVASVTMIGDSTASLRTALRPRFDWSNPFDQGGADYVIEFTRLRGNFEVAIADDLPLDLALDLFTDRADRRVRVRLSEAGWYSVEADGSSVIVTSHGGTALIYGPDSSIGYSVTAGSGSIYTVDTDVIRALPREVQLLQNSQLSPSDTGGTPFPANWVCSSSPDVITEPRGNFSAERLDGREVLRIIRSGTQSPAQTGCFQGLPQGEKWQDISAYEGLSIRTSFYLNYHSLPVCGIEGSECPLMLRLDYINAAGDDSFLIYGFYHLPAAPEQRFPQTCPNCIREHIRVQEKAWYSFDSGNILAGFLADQRPVAITQLRFYAGGHEYDVRVSRVELIAENTAD